MGALGSMELLLSLNERAACEALFCPTHSDCVATKLVHEPRVGQQVRLCLSFENWSFGPLH